MVGPPVSRQSSDQVRRCARCGSATLVVDHAWQHRIAGFDTKTRTLELRCRSCHAKVVLHPWSQIHVERVFAVIMMPALFPGLYFWFSARRKARAWTDNPVVDDAGFVAPRPGPSPRRCKCRGVAPCTAIVREGTWAVLLGIRHEYRCASCHRNFSVHDLRGVVSAVMGSGALLVAGVLVIIHPPGSGVGAERSNRWFGVAMVVLGLLGSVLAASRIRERRAHPVVPT